MNVNSKRICNKCSFNLRNENSCLCKTCEYNLKCDCEHWKIKDNYIKYNNPEKEVIIDCLKYREDWVKRLKYG